MEEVLTIISEKPVSFILGADKKLILYDLLKELNDKSNAKILFVSLEELTVKNAFSQAKNAGLDCSIILNHQDKLNNNINYTTGDILRKIMINNYKNPDFCSIIILDNSEKTNINYNIFYNLWLKCYDKQLGRLPRLILLSNNFINNLPFEIDKENIINLKRKKEIKTEYSDNIYYPSNFNIYDDLITKIKEVDDKIKNCLILLPSTQNIHMFIKKLEDIKDKEIYVVNDNFSEQENNKLFNKVNNKRNFILSSHKNSRLMYYDKLNYIFDGCVTYNEHKDGSRQLINITKNEGSEILNFFSFNGNIYRALKESNYNNLQTYNKYNNINCDYLLYTLELSKINSIDILKDHGLDELNRLNILKAGKFTKEADKILKLPLSIKANLFMLKWCKNNLPIYPGILVALIIDTLGRFWITKNYNNIVNETLIMYLDIMLEFSKEFKTLDVENNKIAEWCKLNNINVRIFICFIKNLKKSIISINNIYPVELGLYNSKNVFEKSKDILCNIYKLNIYENYVKKDHIYQNVKGEKAIIDLEIKSKDFFYPESLIVFNKLIINKYNKGYDIIKFYITLKD